MKMRDAMRRKRLFGPTIAQPRFSNLIEKIHAIGNFAFRRLLFGRAIPAFSSGFLQADVREKKRFVEIELF